MKLLSVAAALFILTGSLIADEVVVEESVAVASSAGDPVSISNINGEIEVTSGSSDQVKVNYTITCDTQEEMDAIQVVCNTDNGIACHVEYDSEWEDSHSGRVDFLVEVPQDIQLDYTIENINGDINFAGASGEAHISLINGNVDVGAFDGDMSVEVINGDVTAEEVPGMNSIEIVNGSILVAVEEILNDLNIESVNGAVKLQLHGDTEAIVEIETMSGDIDIPDNLGGIITEDLVGSTAVFGDGERTIIISTLNGDIEIVE